MAVVLLLGALVEGCASAPPPEVVTKPKEADVMVADPAPPPANPANEKPKEDLETFLRKSASLRPYLDNAAKYRFQVYLSIPDLAEPKWLLREGFRVDAEYFYPASTIKLAVTVAALEKLTQLNEEGSPVDARTPLVYEPRKIGRRKPVYGTATSVVGAMDRALIFSDNVAADTLYDFVGGDELHERMHALGLDSIRMRHRLNVSGMAKSTPAMQLLPAGLDPVLIPARVSKTDLGLNEDALVGGSSRPGRAKIEPMSFAKKNRISVEDLQDLLVSIVRPDLHTPRSTIGAQERALLTRALQTRASERIGTTSQDSIHKTLLPGIQRVVAADDLLVASKSGRAYGFVVENAWVVRMSDSKSFFLTVVLYTNSSGKMSEEYYQYESVAFPVLADLGEAIASRVFK